jgi:LPS-assembly lipoprotein
MAVLVLGPAGCGFQPVYSKPSGAQSSAVAEQLAAVRVLGIEDRIGQQLRNALISQLNPRGEPGRERYTLTVKLQQSSGGMASSKDGNATVERMTISATFILTDTSQGQAVSNGQARAMGSFRYLGPRYASTASERDTEVSLVQEIATEIRTSLAAYFTNPETFQKRYRDDTARDRFVPERTLEPTDSP